AFTPGGFTGFGGWRIYDVAKRTGKTARATATIGVEMILGQLAFGVVVMVASIFGMRFIGTDGVLLVNAVFLSIIIVGLAFLAQPQLFLFFTRFVPEGIRARVQTLIDAVGAYRGKAGLLIQAAALGVGTHAFNNLIYVCAARALGVELSIGEVFFASSLQISSRGSSGRTLHLAGRRPAACGRGAHSHTWLRLRNVRLRVRRRDLPPAQVGLQPRVSHRGP
ncbi:MAG: flippase-like domain-containing protein, partial [Deltaproteobacteria bacterium]|nr:flippase-like domain-containing protein [Deltaproteobacteria bacterium]